MIEPESLQGLTEAEAHERLEAEGYNEQARAKGRRMWRIALEVAREPMFLLLLVCGAIYLMLGDSADALMLLGFVAAVMGITFYQKKKAEAALDELRDQSSPRALVVRGGKKLRIAGREVVRDDILLVSEGDRVPADAVLLRAANLTADESLLTGEALPVRKRAWNGVLDPVKPGGDDLPIIYSGTMIVRGQGIARVLRTGPRTEIGKIGKIARAKDAEETKLQRQTSRIVWASSLVGAACCLVVAVVYGAAQGNRLEGLLAGIALAMAVLPEEFPVVVTIFLALGAWRISKRKVLARRMAAVESLGATTVLCSDKTGTLTMNEMTVAKLGYEGDFKDVALGQEALPESLHEIVEYAVLASPADPFDPMERAVREFASTALARTEHLHHDWRLVREYPLSEKLLAMSHVWESPDRERLVIAAKGSPEAIADLCHFDELRLSMLKADAYALASEGLRVIGFAGSDVMRGDLPDAQHDFHFRLIGLIGLRDPVRPGVPRAVRQCRTAGIRVVMITGDYAGTAVSVARSIGLEAPEAVVTGLELDSMDDAELRSRVSRISIFARVVPEQKLRIVEALKANGEVVAMTGDGVNDAPALKAAHIGIAMGGRGADIARESAALVLLDDDFSSIVSSIRAGRRISDNLRRAMTFIVSVHLPIAGMSLLPLLLGMPLALLPAHILFLELIIDPACSIVLETEEEEKGIMNRPPKPVDEPLFGKEMIRMGLIQGLCVLALAAGVYAWALGSGFGEGEARALAFVNLVLGNLGMIVSNPSRTRSFMDTLRKPSPAMRWVTRGAFAFLALAIFVPFLNDAFGFAPLHLWQIGLCLAMGAAMILMNEAAKLPALLRARREGARHEAK